MFDDANHWQVVFFVSAAVFLTYQVVRGWRLGVARQLVNLLALAAGYATAIFGGRLAAPIFRPLGYPDFIVSLVAGSVLAFIVFAALSSLGALLFRRTAEQEIGLVRISYGAGGSLVGLVFGVVTIWFFVLGIRLLGTVAEAEVQMAAQQPVETSHGMVVRVQPGPMAENLARIKESLDHSAAGAVVQRLDPVPVRAYDVLAKMSRVLSSPASMGRFLDFPGAQPLARHPRILALQSDPAILRAIEERNFLSLLKNQRIVAAANDPEVNALVRRFDLEKALDYALRGNEKSTAPAPGRE